MEQNTINFNIEKKEDKYNLVICKYKDIYYNNKEVFTYKNITLEDAQRQIQAILTVDKKRELRQKIEKTNELIVNLKKDINNLKNQLENLF